MACTIHIQYGPTARSIIYSIQVNLQSPIKNIEIIELRRGPKEFTNKTNMTDTHSVHPKQDISAKSKKFNSEKTNSISVRKSINPMTFAYGIFSSKAVYYEFDGDRSCDHFISNTQVNVIPTHVEMEKIKHHYICRFRIPRKSCKQYIPTNVDSGYQKKFEQ